ncbi:MAG: DUF4038 domain-containing protein [Clostridiales bacterium]|jgi:hypothetical protein|nr:DUF4038 domain-containing protein [Clostridiales bacterium]
MGIISPIRVSSNGRYFVDENGSPVFWLGDTLWELFRMFTRDEALEILKDRQRKGFNIILVMLTGVDLREDKLDRSVPFTNIEGEEPWIDNDPLKPNEKYFEHIDKMIRLGEETGQIFVVGVYHQWHTGIITMEKARAWARWVSNRYRDVPNLIWSMYPKATDEYIPVCRELARGLQEGDEGRHMISVHPDPSVASSSFIHDEKWLAFNMIQTCIMYDKIYETVTEDYMREPVKPVVMAEGGYEGVEFGKLQTPHDIRKQAYWTQLAGGHHVYGHNDNWIKPRAWKEWIDSPGSGFLKVFREIITSCDGWWDMIPDQTIFIKGQGEGFALNTAARSQNGDWILAYLSEPSTVTLRLDDIKSGSGVNAYWIDPKSGDRKPAGVYSVDDTPSFTTPEGWEDAVLYFSAE